MAKGKHKMHREPQGHFRKRVETAKVPLRKGMKRGGK